VNWPTRGWVVSRVAFQSVIKFSDSPDTCWVFPALVYSKGYKWSGGGGGYSLKANATEGIGFPKVRKLLFK
jgi:hypothetical protein